MVNKILTQIGYLCLILLAGWFAGICLISMLYPRPLICIVTDLKHPDGKVVKCQRVGSDVSGNYEIDATSTEYVAPAYTSTPELPIPWKSPTPTEAEYPPPEVTPTPTEPIPYPYPLDPSWWYKR